MTSRLDKDVVMPVFKYTIEHRGSDEGISTPEIKLRYDEIQTSFPEFIEKMHSNAQHMGNLLNDMKIDLCREFDNSLDDFIADYPLHPINEAVNEDDSIPEMLDKLGPLMDEFPLNSIKQQFQELDALEQLCVRADALASGLFYLKTHKIQSSNSTQPINKDELKKFFSQLRDDVREMHSISEKIPEVLQSDGALQEVYFPRFNTEHSNQEMIEKFTDDLKGMVKNLDHICQETEDAILNAEQNKTPQKPRFERRGDDLDRGFGSGRA